MMPSFNKHHKSCLYIVVFLFVMLQSGKAFADHTNSINILGNTLPPFGFIEENELKGFSLDLLKELLQAQSEDIEINVQHVPFARAFAQLQQHDNSIAMHIARSPDREDLFKWVGPYYRIHMGLIGRTSRSFDIDKFEDLKNLKVAVVRDTLLQSILLKKGFPKENISIVSNPVSALKMLIAERVDLFAHIPSVSYFLLERELDTDPNLFEEKYSLQTGDFHFALSKDFEDDYVASLQATLNNLIQNQSLRPLYSQYNLINRSTHTALNR